MFTLEKARCLLRWTSDDCRESSTWCRTEISCQQAGKSFLLEAYPPILVKHSEKQPLLTLWEVLSHSLQISRSWIPDPQHRDACLLLGFVICTFAKSWALRPESLQLLSPFSKFTFFAGTQRSINLLRIHYGFPIIRTKPTRSVQTWEIWPLLTFLIVLVQPNHQNFFHFAVCLCPVSWSDLSYRLPSSWNIPLIFFLNLLFISLWPWHLLETHSDLPWPWFGSGPFLCSMSIYSLFYSSYSFHHCDAKYLI